MQSSADEIGRNSWLFGEFWSETKFARHFGEFSSQLLFGFIRNFADWFTEDFRGSRNSERKFAPPVDPRETFQRNFRFTLQNSWLLRLPTSQRNTWNFRCDLVFMPTATVATLLFPSSRCVSQSDQFSSIFICTHANNFKVNNDLRWGPS